MSNTASAVNLAHGLALLMMHEDCRYFKHLDECNQYTNPLSEHPFGLDLPSYRHFSPEIRFVGASATDMTVEAFLANIRFWVGCTENCMLSKLRVIKAPVGYDNQEHNFVFFEVWAGQMSIISGEMPDCGGTVGTDRRDLEDVFAILSQVYGVPIERVQLKEPADLNALYEAEKVH